MTVTDSRFPPENRSMGALSVPDPRALAGLPSETPLLVALSGGADSVALLSLLRGHGAVFAAHVHHGIRGAEADRDAAFCRDLCAALNIPFFCLRVDAPARAREKSESLESAAREARYEALSALMRERRIPLLVTAHHADDQLESLLLHLVRGSGLSGLGGMSPCRTLGEGQYLVRPLLSFSRAELHDYLRGTGLPHVEDSTNETPCCERNILRAQVLPVLEKLRPGAARRAARCAESLRADEATLTALAADFLAQEGEEPRVAALSALPPPVFYRVLRALLPQNPGYEQFEKIRALVVAARPHAALSLPGCRVSVEGGRLTVGSSPLVIPPYCRTARPGRNEVPDGLVIFGADAENFHPADANVYKYSIRMYFQPDKIKEELLSGRLTLRTRVPGDRLFSGGCHRAVRKLPGLSPLPVPVRAGMPLLCDAAGVLAVPFGGARDGVCAKNGYPVTFYFHKNRILQKGDYHDVDEQGH